MAPLCLRATEGGTEVCVIPYMDAHLCNVPVVRSIVTLLCLSLLALLQL